MGLESSRRSGEQPAGRLGGRLGGAGAQRDGAGAPRKRAGSRAAGGWTRACGASQLSALREACRGPRPGAHRAGEACRPRVSARRVHRWAHRLTSDCRRGPSTGPVGGMSGPGAHVRGPGYASRSARRRGAGARPWTPRRRSTCAHPDSWARACARHGRGADGGRGAAGPNENRLGLRWGCTGWACGGAVPCRLPRRRSFDVKTPPDLRLRQVSCRPTSRPPSV